MSSNPYLSPLSDPGLVPVTESDSVKKGRKLVSNIAYTLVAISAASIASLIEIQGLENLGRRLVRFGFTLIIAYYLCRGATWARYLAVVLYGFGALVAVFGFLSIVQSDRYVFSAVLFGMAVVYGGSAAILALSGSVNDFFSDRKRRS